MLKKFITLLTPFFTSLFILAITVGCGDNQEIVAKKLGFESKEQMYKIQAEGWHTFKKYKEDQAALNLDKQREEDEKKWSTPFNSLSDYLNAKNTLKELGVPEARETEFFSIGADKWKALIEREKKEAEAKIKEEEAQKLAEEKNSAEKWEWESRCQRFAAAKDQCAVAASVANCMVIKIGSFDFEMSNIYCDGSKPNWFLMGKR